MSMQRKILDEAKEYDSSVLEHTSRSELWECLRAWFAVCEEGRQKQGTKTFDEERLSEAGLLVGASKHENLDRDTLDWYLERPTATRYEIMTGFLMGYWHTTKHANADAILKVLHSLNELPLVSWVYAVSLLALYEAVSSKIVVPDSLLQDVQTALLDNLRRLEEQGLHKGVAQYLEYLRP